MPDRVPDIHGQIYTDTNPENIIPAKKDAWFFRKAKKFYVNHSGDIAGQWIELPYTTVILPRPNPNKIIIYEHNTMLWKKHSDGFRDEFRELLPKTDWKFYSYEDVFTPAFQRNFNWFFPAPTSSYDGIGNNGNRSYDENFFYYKSSSLWYRAPITLYDFPGRDQGEDFRRYDYLPYVVAPRSLPVPTGSKQQDKKDPGDQSYDEDYFYIKPSKWKRTSLNVFDSGSKMTMF